MIQEDGIMGTRADFYIGRGKGAEWIGSIAWDGYPDGIAPAVLAATTEDTFRSEVSTFLSLRKDGIVPSDGWPWPWNNSQLTDYSYALDGGKVYRTPFGHGWVDPQILMCDQEDDFTVEKVDFPDMSALTNNPPIGSLKSGVMAFVGVNPVEIPMPAPDRDRDCFTKARALGEPTFTLRAQDITADLLIDLWVAIQQEVAKDVSCGMTISDSMETIRAGLAIAAGYPVNLPIQRTGDAHLDEALDKAEAMRRHPNRKLAD